eukprot:GHVT01096399.1.p1 GENE.GHVT01096399.1~~GHVT01096399.1.p1  ORF type:complete len:198 (+),score=60.69 GHVT01096399.1:214-807(+)
MAACAPRAFERAGARLRSLLTGGGCLALPGAFNGLVGRLVAEAGFSACYLSGAALAASKGLPDIGLITADHFAAAIEEITLASGLPCLADADVGFGEAEQVARSVWTYHRAGAAGFHLEDQEVPKRCGHLADKRLVAPERMIEKIRAAKQAALQCSDGDFVVCARTDARAVEGKARPRPTQANSRDYKNFFFSVFLL